MLGLECAMQSWHEVLPALLKRSQGVALLGSLSVKPGSLSWTLLAKHLSRPELDQGHHLPRSW